MFVCSILKPANCCANTCARSAVGIALKKMTTPSELRYGYGAGYAVLRCEASLEVSLWLDKLRLQNSDC